SLASAADARKGGAHGSAVMPGKPGESLILRMISGDKPMMPMQGTPLSPTEIHEIRTWIEQGAPWPENLRADRRKSDLWSLRPLSKRSGPASIDAFVLATLREKKLTPSPEAGKATLIRRLSYDLHG